MTNSKQRNTSDMCGQQSKSCVAVVAQVVLGHTLMNIFVTHMTRATLLIHFSKSCLIWLSLSDFFAEQERDIGGRSQKCFKNEPYAWLQNTHTQQIVNIRSFYGPPRVFEAEAICYNKAMKIRYCRHLTNRICIFLRLGPPCLLASQFQVCQRGDNMIMIFKPFVMHANSFKAEIRNFNLSNRAKVR